MYGAVVVDERPAPIDPEIAARLLAGACAPRGWSDGGRAAAAAAALRRAAVDDRRAAARGSRRDAGRSTRSICAARSVGRSPQLDRRAPDDARRAERTDRGRWSYHDDGSVVAAVKLQELFGLAETPRLGPRRRAGAFELLAPNGRPVQTTRDLRSFWDTTYPEVRKELRGRYPRHPWPEDPWTAPPARPGSKTRAGQVSNAVLVPGL